MADGRPAGVLLHQALVLAAMAQAEDLADGADVLVGVDQLVAVRDCRWSCRRPVGRGSGCPAASAACSRETSLRPLLGTQRADAPARQMVDRGHAAFVVQFAHRSRPQTSETQKWYAGRSIRCSRPPGTHRPANAITSTPKRPQPTRMYSDCMHNRAMAHRNELPGDEVAVGASSTCRQSSRDTPFAQAGLTLS